MIDPFDDAILEVLTICYSRTAKCHERVGNLEYELKRLIRAAIHDVLKKLDLTDADTIREFNLCVKKKIRIYYVIVLHIKKRKLHIHTGLSRGGRYAFICRERDRRSYQSGAVS